MEQFIYKYCVIKDFKEPNLFCLYYKKYRLENGKLFDTVNSLVAPTVIAEYDTEDAAKKHIRELNNDPDELYELINDINEQVKMNYSFDKNRLGRYLYKLGYRKIKE